MYASKRAEVMPEIPGNDRPDLVMEWMRFYQSLEDMYVALAQEQLRPYQRATNQDLEQRAATAAATGDRPGDVMGHGLFWPGNALSGSPSRPAVPTRPASLRL